MNDFRTGRSSVFSTTRTPAGMTECWDVHSLSMLLTFQDLRTTQRETTQSSGPCCSPCKSVSSSGGLSGWNRRDQHVPWLRSNKSLSLWCEPSSPGGSGAQYSPVGVPLGLLWLSLPPAQANPSHPWSKNCPHPRKDRRAGSTPWTVVPFPGLHHSSPPSGPFHLSLSCSQSENF